MTLVANGDLISVATQLSGDLRVGSASVLFTANPPPTDFDVSRDVAGFFSWRPGREIVPRTVDLMTIANWTGELPEEVSPGPEVHMLT